MLLENSFKLQCNKYIFNKGALGLRTDVIFSTECSCEDAYKAPGDFLAENRAVRFPIGRDSL